MFSEEEKEILLRYVSNVDKDVFVLKNMPEIIKGTLFSRYSRSPKSLRRLLLDEFINNDALNLEKTTISTDSELNVKKAEDFYERVYIGFGDESVAELAGIHVAVENISNIVTKYIEDTRIGISPLEKSSRYVKFDEKIDGKYNYYREPSLMEFDGRLYEESMDKLFDTYSKLLTEMEKYFMEKFPDNGQKGYKQVIRAKTCDTVRYLLPACTKTNVGLFGNARAFAYLLNKMYVSNLVEVRTVAENLYNELSKFIKVFIKRTKHTEEYINYEINSKKELEKHLPKDRFSNNDEDLELLYYDKDAELRVASMVLFENTNLSYKDCYDKVSKMTREELAQLFDSFYKYRTNRRHKPPRAFELANYVFSIKADFGAYRDLHRHRILTQRRQLLNTRLGYDIPRDIIEAGYDSEYRDALETAANAYDVFSKKSLEAAQYVVPFAYKIRWYMAFNLREAYHLCELRSSKKGHPSYRKIVQNMYKKIREVHPLFRMDFVDMNDYSLARDEEVKKFMK